jgi:hypothetical protein
LGLKKVDCAGRPQFLPQLQVRNLAMQKVSVYRSVFGSNAVGNIQRGRRGAEGSKHKKKAQGGAIGERASLGPKLLPRLP